MSFFPLESKINKVKPKVQFSGEKKINKHPQKNSGPSKPSFDHPPPSLKKHKLDIQG